MRIYKCIHFIWTFLCVTVHRDSEAKKQNSSPERERTASLLSHRVVCPTSAEDFSAPKLMSALPERFGPGSRRKQVKVNNHTLYSEAMKIRMLFFSPPEILRWLRFRGEWNIGTMPLDAGFSFFCFWISQLNYVNLLSVFWCFWKYEAFLWLYHWNVHCRSALNFLLALYVIVFCFVFFSCCILLDNFLALCHNFRKDA